MSPSFVCHTQPHPIDAGQGIYLMKNNSFYNINIGSCQVLTKEFCYKNFNYFKIFYQKYFYQKPLQIFSTSKMNCSIFSLQNIHLSIVINLLPFSIKLYNIFFTKKNNLFENAGMLFFIGNILIVYMPFEDAREKDDTRIYLAR